MAMIDDSIPAVPIAVGIVTVVGCCHLGVELLGLSEQFKTPVFEITAWIGGMVTAFAVSMFFGWFKDLKPLWLVGGWLLFTLIGVLILAI